MDGKDVVGGRGGQRRRRAPRRRADEKTVRSTAVPCSSVAASWPSAAVGAVRCPAQAAGAARTAADGERGRTAGGGVGQGDGEVRILNWTEYIDPTDGRRRRARSTGSATRPASRSTTPRRSTTTTRCTPRSSRPTSMPASRRRGTSPCPTYWMAARLKQQGWLAPLPFNLIPNYVNLDPSYLNLGWDPGAKYHLPWQAGFTGIAYNSTVTGRELTKHQRPVRSRVQGQDRLLHRDARLGRAGDAGPGQRPVAGRPRTTMNEALDKIEEADERATRSAASPATTTSRTSRAGTSRRASRGPATSPRPPTPTSTSCSPRRVRWRGSTRW